MKKTEAKTKKEEENVVGTIPTRGRILEGTVIKKFSKRAVIEFERTIYIKKYERFMKKKTRIHSRIPSNMEVQIGDYIQVRECRPLSKIVHSVVTKIIKKAGEENESN